MNKLIPQRIYFNICSYGGFFMNINDESNSKVFIKSVAVSVVVGIIISLVLTILFSVILTTADFPEYIVGYISTAIIAAGAFFTGMFSAKFYKKRGLITGMISGIIYYLFFTLIAVAVSKDGLTSVFLLRMILVIAFSSFGGIIGINRINKRKIV